MTTRSKGGTAPSGSAPRSLPANSRPTRYTPGAKKSAFVPSRLDAEKLQELVLPLADQRLRHDQQDTPRPFRAALGDDQASLDRLSETDLVRENAAALAKTPERKDHRVDLVRVGINPRLALRSRIALPVVRTADPHEVLGEHAQIEGVERHRGTQFTSRQGLRSAQRATVRCVPVFMTKPSARSSARLKRSSMARSVRPLATNGFAFRPRTTHERSRANEHAHGTRIRSEPRCCSRHTRSPVVPCLESD